MIRQTVTVLSLLVVAFSPIAIGACTKKAEKPLVTPAAALSSSRIEPGVLTTVTYRFAMASDAPAFTEDYHVFVHAVDEANFVLWTDDHTPATPTTQWKPGSTIEYTRQMYVPTAVATGPAELEVGLYAPSTGQRVPMDAPTKGMKAYRLARMNVVPPRNSPPAFGNGWNNQEGTEDGNAWRWTKASGELMLPNPRKDATLILIVDQPVTGLPWTQALDVRIGATTVDHSSLPAGEREIKRIPVPAPTLGDSPLVRVTLAVDKPFVPRSIASLRNIDARELGVRLFAAYFEER
jgi:hypothetical protein